MGRWTDINQKMGMKLFFIIFIFIQVSVCLATDRYEIRIPLSGVYQVFPADLDNDKGLDLIVLHRKADELQFHSSRLVSLFFQQSNNFKPNPDVQYKADMQDIIIDWADCNGDGFTEFFIIRPESIVSWSPQLPDSIIPVLSSTSIFSGADSDRMVHWPFLWDVNQDSSLEIILNQKQGLDIYSKDSLDHYRFSIRLDMRFKHTLIQEKSLILQTCLPQIVLKEMNRDNWPDIVAVFDDRLAVFTSQIQPDMIDDETFLSSQEIQFAIEDPHLSMLEALAPTDMSIEVEDLNRDGYSDVILSRASKASFTKTLSQLQIYFSRRGQFQTLPDQVLMAENFYGDHAIADFNHDGRKDMALLQFPIGLVGAAKFLLTRRIKYGFDIYLQTPNGQFNNEPDQQLRFIRHSKIRNVLKPEFFTFADWNGDHLLDLLVNIDHQRIVCFIQKDVDEFSKKPDFEINIPVSPHFWIGDLNKDRQADLVFWYENPGEIRCLISGSN